MSEQRRPGRYPAELRERAVRMVFEAERHTGSQWEAICSVADKLGPGDVDLDRCEIAIVRQRQLDRHGVHLVGPPKSDAGKRVLALPEVLVGDLQDHLNAYAQPGDDGYVFTGEKGGPLGPHVWQGAWEKARTEIGVPEIHLHDLRHLAGTLAASVGASTKEVMHRLGHATHQAALRYQHATRQRDRAIADALDRLIDPGRH